MFYLNPRSNYEVERNFWNDFFAPVSISRLGSMKTDVTENDSEYLFDIELAGYGKDDVKISYDDGYLKVEASKNSEKENNEEKTYITRERYSGSVSRSWYVGNIDRNLIKASFNNGILTVSVPKQQLEKQEESNYITIE